MVGKSTLYKWLHQDKRADVRLYLDMVRHSLDSFKGRRSAVWLASWFSPTPITELLDVSKRSSLTTTKKSRNKNYFNKELLVLLTTCIIL